MEANLGDTSPTEVSTKGDAQRDARRGVDVSSRQERRLASFADREVGAVVAHFGGMKTNHSLTALTLAAAALLATSNDARAQGRGASQGVPPGQLPPAGMCRVWYEGQPPGHQPPPTDCRDAEAIAARSRDARVIYGNARSGRWDRNDRSNATWGVNISGQWGRGGSRYGYPGGYGGYYQRGPAFDLGYRDGLDKGREDRRDRDRDDPVRHGRYRSADHGYQRRYGPRDVYRGVYRQGFLAGYEEAYRAGYGNYRRGW